jgi:hypothetical protein
MRAYRFIVICLLLVNFLFTLVLYKAYYVSLSLGYQNALLLKTIMRHYDILCSIMDVYGPVSSLGALWYSARFFRAYQILPPAEWNIGSPPADYAGAIGETIQHDSLYSLFEWANSLSQLQNLNNYDALFSFTPIRLIYDFLGNLMFSAFGFYLSPALFLILGLAVIFGPMFYYAFIFDPADSLIYRYAKRLYQLEIFVSGKLNNNKPIEFSKTAWTPAESVLKGGSAPFFDPYVDHWLNEIQKRERDEQISSNLRDRFAKMTK